MKNKKNIAFLVVCCSFVLVSCDEARVNDRPLGSGVSAAPYNTTSNVAPDSQRGAGLLSDLAGGETATGATNDPGTLFNPNVGNENNNGPVVTNAGGSGASTVTNPVISNGAQTAANNAGAEENIPVGWMDPNDPTIVISPYNRNHKYRIKQKDGTLMPSGKVLRDNKYPTSENKKFMIP